MSDENITFPVISSCFSLGKNTTSKNSSGGRISFIIQDRGFIPFNQSCIKQNKDIAKKGPNKEKPFFIVR